MRAGLVLALSAVLYAHGDLHEQIARVSKRIEREPGNAALYLERGELNRLHQTYREAWGDFDRAERLDPSLVAVDYHRGLLRYDTGKFKEAKKHFDRYLARQPERGSGYLWRARTLVKLREPLAAARDYTRAIERSRRPQPDFYIERARALARSGKTEPALAGLAEGIRKLGAVVSLELEAIDLETRLKRYDAALARVDRLAARSARKETWLVRRGEILERAGRKADAQQTYVRALRGIESLPAGRRRTRAMRELEERVRAALGRLSEPKRTGTGPDPPGKNEGGCQDDSVLTYCARPRARGAALRGTRVRSRGHAHPDRRGLEVPRRRL